MNIKTAATDATMYFTPDGIVEALQAKLQASTLFSAKLTPHPAMMLIGNPPFDDCIQNKVNLLLL